MNTYLVKSTGMIVALAMALASCSGKKDATQQDVAATDTVAVEGVEILPLDDVTAVWLQDNAQEKLMPRTLLPMLPTRL